ncbi:MAG: TatD family hydrolase [Candidatus Symbiothrix sp.]|jgi:TatD DNase family protein|nr:TatD family hydrolase [Candidatus Symbiothrix sp.]
MIDTHAHLFEEIYDEDIAGVVARAVEAGVSKICVPNLDAASIPRLNALCDRFPAICFPMMGIHPTNITPDFRHDLSEVHKALEARKYIAIGEVGIDLYWDKSLLKEQTEAFETQLFWSIEYDLPVSIHAREAFPQVFESLYKVGVDKLRGAFHCFTGTGDELAEALKCEKFLIGIDGPITYKKADFRDYLTIAPLDRLLLETDAPYLSPVPMRGKRNEPAYMVYTAQKLAEIYGCSLDEVMQTTTKNAEKLFNI